MADIFWKTWELDCFHQGSQEFFNTVNLSENQYFPELKEIHSVSRNVLLLSFLPNDKPDFINWLANGGSKWIKYLASLSKNTIVYSSLPLPENLFEQSRDYRHRNTEFVNVETEPAAVPLFSNAPQTPQVRIKDIYLPTILFDAENIIPVTCTQDSYQFGIFSILSSLFHLLPTITQVEIMLLPTKTMQSQALVQTVEPLIKKMKLGIHVNLHPKPFMVVSNDVVSADAYSAMLNGIRVSSLSFLSAASKKRLGISDVLMIHTRTDRFYRSINQKKVKWGRRSIVRINEETCTNCGDCISSCPLQALSKIDKEFIRWNPAKCNRCGYCLDICPEKSIS